MRPHSYRLSVIAALLLGVLAAAARPARAEDPAALFAQGLRYEHAEGVPRDYDRALALYCDAARQGSADAAFSIGWMYLNARGVQRNDAVGVAWLRLAAERGNPQAPRLLAVLSDVPAAEAQGCAAPAPTKPRPVLPAKIAGLVTKIAAEFKLDPALLTAVIATESAFQSDAISPKGAQGLMQLTGGTAERFRVGDVFEPAENIRGGAKYLRWLLARFDGNLSLALAAYNAGEKAVDRYGGIPPYAETRAYVQKILALYGDGNGIAATP